MTETAFQIPGAPPPPSPDSFARRRERLLDRLGNGVAVVPAAPELLRSRDTDIRYRPGTDLWYLTGFPEPEAVAVFSGVADHRFTLFVRPRDPQREVWTGPRIGVEAAKEMYGADAAYPIHELGERLPGLVRPASVIHYPVAFDPALDERVLAIVAAARRERQRSGVGPTGIQDLDPLVGEMRKVKDADEIERIRAAAAVSVHAHRAAMERARPGAGEWEIQAAAEAVMREMGGAGPAFPTIVGSGPNATILHYVANERRVGPDDLVLVDAGAEWGMYCGDITRTVPASGRFTTPQREVYDVVLAAERAGIAAARPGAAVADVHQAAVREISRGLLELGIIQAADVDEAVANGLYKPFYMHQTSHWLGLDVHDAGLYHVGGEPARLEPGMVLTVEPGLYIRADAPDVPAAYRGIGVRIEDDVLVTAQGHEVLTAALASEPEEVERGDKYEL